MFKEVTGILSNSAMALLTGWKGRKRTVGQQAAMGWTMTEYFRCIPCQKVSTILPGDETKCGACGGSNGELLSAERFDQGFKAGVYFNIDPKTGGRAKDKKKRR